MLYRRWYDNTLHFQCNAILGLPGDDQVDQLKLNERLTLVPEDRLSVSDHTYVAGCRLMQHAADELAESPYKNANRELSSIRERLLTRRVSPYFANIVVGGATHGEWDRDLSALENRWVALNGMQYRVSSASVSTTVTGIDQLTVEDEDGQLHVLSPDTIDVDHAELLILPSGKYRQTYRIPNSQNGKPPFYARRGPPVQLPLSDEFLWKYRLVYDHLNSVWTDEKSVKAHELIADAERKWTESDIVALSDEAIFHTNRGDALTAAKKYDDALHEYTLAIDLPAQRFSELHLPANAAPLPDASRFLRRGALQSLRGLLTDAIADLETARRLASTEHAIGAQAAVAPLASFLESRIYSIQACNLPLADYDSARIKHASAITLAAELTGAEVSLQSATNSIPPVQGALSSLTELAQRHRALAMGYLKIDRMDPVQPDDLKAILQRDAGLDLLLRGEQFYAQTGDWRSHATGALAAFAPSRPELQPIDWTSKTPNHETDRRDGFNQAAEKIVGLAKGAGVDKVESAARDAKGCVRDSGGIKITSFLPGDGSPFPEKIGECTNALATVLSEEAALLRLAAKYEDRISAYWLAKEHPLTALRFSAAAGEHLDAADDVDEVKRESEAKHE